MIRFGADEAETCYLLLTYLGLRGITYEGIVNTLCRAANEGDQAVLGDPHLMKILQEPPNGENTSLEHMKELIIEGSKAAGSEGVLIEKLVEILSSPMPRNTLTASDVHALRQALLLRGEIEALPRGLNCSICGRQIVTGEILTLRTNRDMLDIQARCAVCDQPVQYQCACGEKHSLTKRQRTALRAGKCPHAGERREDPHPNQREDPHPNQNRFWEDPPPTNQHEIPIRFFSPARVRPDVVDDGRDFDEGTPRGVIFGGRRNEPR